MSLNFVQGDTAPDLDCVLVEEDDQTNIIDLTDATGVRFQMRKEDDHRYTVNAGAAVIGDPLDGQVRYSWGANDLAVPGDYIGQWEVTYLGGRVQTTVFGVPISVRRQ